MLSMREGSLWTFIPRPHRYRSLFRDPSAGSHQESTVATNQERIMHRFSSVLAVVALAATATAQFTLVTPNGYASTVGNTNNTYPWARNAASMRIQFLIDSTHFTSQ